MAELQQLHPLTSTNDSGGKNDHRKRGHQQKLFNSKNKWIFCSMLLILIAGWITAIVFMVLWEICHERRILPEPFVSDTAMRRFFHAAAATDDQKCSEIAKNFMEQGGNAVDGAIAGLLCNGIQNSQSMGLGGGFFMVIYNSTTRSCTTIDARETAPQRATKEFFDKNPQARLLGANSIGVPGEIAGYWEAHQRFGSMPWKSLFQPSIQLAEKGFVLHKGMSNVMKMVGAEKLNDSSFDFLFDEKTGNLHNEGDFLRRPIFAQTLKELANAADPVELFYRGTMAKIAVSEIQTNGGRMTPADFATYQPRITSGHMVKLKNGLNLCVPPPPSSGAALGFFFQLLEALNLPKDSTKKDVDSVLHFYHYILEALKYTMAEWIKIADSDGYDELDFIIGNLSSAAYIEEIKSRITSRSKHDADHYTEHALDTEDEGTAHLSFVDRQGNAVAVTSTINWVYGSGRRSKTLGIIWNNELADFDEPIQKTKNDRPPNPQNIVKPGRRPRSAMSPSIFFNPDSGEVQLVTGASGGSQIISAIAQVSARVLFFNETIKVATDAPRVHNALFPYETKYEATLPEVILKGLEGHGHRMDSSFSFPSVVQSIYRKNGVLYAQSDYRKGGDSAGF